jgi:hypothetical protein
MKNLRYIEKVWTGPMANSIDTRVRAAIWDTMRLAASLATGPSKRKIEAELKADMELFDKFGQPRKP